MQCHTAYFRWILQYCKANRFLFKTATVVVLFFLYEQQQIWGFTITKIREWIIQDLLYSGTPLIIVYKVQCRLYLLVKLCIISLNSEVICIPKRRDGWAPKLFQPGAFLSFSVMLKSLGRLSGSEGSFGLSTSPPSRVSR